MRWIAQVGHVSAKDVRQSRWTIIALFVALALAAYGFVTRNAFGPSRTSATSMTLAMPEVNVTWLPIVIVLLGIIAMATLVQAERPLQADSFWTTRPLSSTAVFAAKLLLAIVAITVPSLVAAFVSLRALHTPGMIEASMLAHAALVHLALLLAAIIVAALTEDMKGFVAVSVMLLGGLIAATVLLTWLLPADFTYPSGIAFAAPVAAVLLLTFLYRGRMTGTKQWIAGLAVAMMLVMGATVAPAFSVSSVPTHATGPRLSLTFGAPGPTSMTLPFMVRVDDESSARFAFARDLTLISSEHGTQRLTPPHDTLVVGPQFPDLGRPVRWLTPPFSFPTMGQLALSPADSHAVARGATSAELSGTVTVLRPRVLATLPLRDGAFAEHDGRYVGIYGVSHDTTKVSVYVHTVNPPLTERHEPQFVVVNYSRGEAVLLDEHPSSGTSQGWIVLPWISVSSSFDQFSTNSRTPVPRDSEWYAGASLVAVDWIPVARYRASATMALR